MKKLRMAFFDSKPYDIQSFDRVNKDFGFEIKYFQGHISIDNVEITKGFDIVCIFVNDNLTREIADVLYSHGIRLVALRSAGYNNVDLKAVYKRIHVVRVPAYSPHAVAEHAVALMLSLNRKTHKAYSRTRDNNFTINGLLGFDMYGKTAGIIGTGRIGILTAEILKGFGMNVLAFDRFPKVDEAARAGFRYVDMDTLLAES
ncbi:MAG: 2-hydroxyacid dehydrogenase, partial [Spirochaetaceae bacterium]